MRIAQLTNFVGPTPGGSRRAMDKLGLGYVGAGHDRLLIVPGAHDQLSTSLAGAVVTVRSPVVTLGTRVVMNTGKVIDILKRFRPDVLEVSDRTTMTPAAMWARKHGIGTILLSHHRVDDQASVRLDMDLSGPIHAVNARLAKVYDRVVVTSRYATGEWLATLADLAIQPLGVDLDEFTPGLEGANHDNGPLRLVCAGRLNRGKSPDLAVATAMELDRRGQDVQLDVFGTGPMSDELRSLADGSPVFFHGYLDSREAMARAYRAADIAVSLSPAETFGMTCLEALACGTPVVTCDRGGARECVDASCAEWSPPDPVFVADAVTRLAARIHADRSGMAQAARAQAEKYPWSAAVDGMLRIHADVLASPRT